MHPNFIRGNHEKTQNTYIRRDEININITLTFNLHNSLLNNDKRYIKKIILKPKLI